MELVQACYLPIDKKVEFTGISYLIKWWYHQLNSTSYYFFGAW
jgi:hypothetical protein